jgi:hypothetical protein
MIFYNEIYFKSNNTVKNLLLTCCVLAAALSQATAQASKSIFEGNINAFVVYTSQNSTGGVNMTYNKLNQLMQDQITYLKNTISTSMATHAADSTKASADMRASTGANNARQHSAAEAEVRKAQAELGPINQYKANLATDNTLMTNINTLFKNSTANKDAIIAALHQFAATLH